MKDSDLKKFRCAVRMITDGTIEDYKNMDLITNEFDLKTISRMISGLDIISIHKSFFTY